VGEIAIRKSNWRAWLDRTNATSSSVLYIVPRLVFLAGLQSPISTRSLRRAADFGRARRCSPSFVKSGPGASTQPAGEDGMFASLSSWRFGDLRGWSKLVSCA
jgi:hypothetical protein